jgi:hypothetical protein
MTAQTHVRRQSELANKPEPAIELDGVIPDDLTGWYSGSPYVESFVIDTEQQFPFHHAAI